MFAVTTVVKNCITVLWKFVIIFYILIMHLNWIIVKKSKINAYHGFHIGYQRKTKEQSKSVDIPLNS